MRKPLWGLLAVLALAQLWPIDRDNPAVTAAFTEPASIRGIIERACYDCHSNQTKWPWYAYVAPVSWLVAHDVHEGREHLNFSEWGALTPDERREHQEEIWEEVEEGEMPLWVYALLHPSAKLSQSERENIRAWSQTGDASPE